MFETNVWNFLKLKMFTAMQGLAVLLDSPEHFDQTPQAQSPLFVDTQHDHLS